MNKPPTNTISPSQIVVFSIFTISYLLSYFFRGTNAVIAPSLSREFDLQAGDLGLMTSIFFLAFALSQPIIGELLDRVGPRLVQSLLLLVAVVGSLVFFLAHSLPMLMLGRLLLGLGLAGSLMAPFKAFPQWFSPAQLPLATGLLMSLGAIGALVAGTPLANFAANFGWRSVFIFGAALALAMALVVWFFLRNTPNPTAKTSTDDSNGRLSDVFANPKLWRIGALNFFLAGVLLSVQSLWAGPYLYDVYRFDSQQVGGLISLLGLGSVFGYGMMGVFIRYFGITRTVIVVALFFLLLQLALAAQIIALALPVLFCFGFFGAGNMALLSHARASVASNLTGRATTLVNLCGIGGTFVLQWLLGLVIARFPQVEGHYPAVAYATVFIASAAATLLALIGYLPLWRDLD
jgi:sugar phosphate permease